MLLGSYYTAFIVGQSRDRTEVPTIYTTTSGNTYNPIFDCEANNYRSRIQKTKQVVSIRGVETHTRLWLLSFCSTAAGKRAFRTQHFTAAAIPRLTGHGSPPNLESVCSTKLRILAAKFEGRRWFVSRVLAWDVEA